MIDHCFRCQRLSPPCESSEYVDWHEVVTQRGEYLGLLCVGCLADEHLVLIHAQDAYALVA